MHANLFHVYRNTPLGRETLMQSIYFCKTLDLELIVYIPDAVRLLLTAPVFKPWKSIAVLFGGSDSAMNALRSGIQLARRSGFPLTCSPSSKPINNITISVCERRDWKKRSNVTAGIAASLATGNSATTCTTSPTMPWCSQAPMVID